MVFRDQMLVCDQCGDTFFFTVTEQRRMAEERGDQEIETPHLCPKCRQSKSEPVSVQEVPVGVASQEHAAEPGPAAEPAVQEMVAAPEAAIRSEPAPAPELELEAEPEPDREPVSEALPAFDESFLEDIGITVKLIGNVKWFSRRKGFGFVTKADGEELFFHRSDVLDADLGQLRDGTRVEFQVRRTEKGLEAFDVSVLPAA
jgi:CspA family cold shock protein